MKRSKSPERYLLAGHLLIVMRRLGRLEIQKAIANPDWQEVRLSMKGVSTQRKFELMAEWFEVAKDKKMAEVQIINYINALKRGGQVK